MSRHQVFVVATLAAVLFTAAPLLAQTTWIAGESDWFDPENWDSGVPNLATDAAINNGGTATVAGDTVPQAMSLDIGVDGGTGRFSYLATAGGFTLTVAGSLNVGFTQSGAATSTGTLSFAGGGSARGIDGDGSGVFRLGVTEADGDAEGTISTAGFTRIESGSFTALHLGVSSGAGNATALTQSLTMDQQLDIEDMAAIEIGVSKAAGDADAEVMMDRLEGVGTLSVGVAGSTGTANGLLQTATLAQTQSVVGFGITNAAGDATGEYIFDSGRMDGDSTGDLDIGVSNGSGAASGRIVKQSFFSTFNPNIRGFLNINIGIANSDGDANGSLVMEQGIEADNEINVGIANGSGSAAGAIEVRRAALIRAATLNLGSGATTTLGLQGTDRATFEGYASIEATTANLDGTLNAKFTFVPPAAQDFELVRSGSPTGINGSFSTINVLNLNQGYASATSTLVDGGVEKLILSLSGAPIEPDWINPGTGGAAGNWFDPANWSSPLVPGSGDPATISNGGEANADSSTAPGSMEPFSLLVGADGGDGTLTSKGVDLHATDRFNVGSTSATHAGAGTTTGTATFDDADISLTTISNIDAGQAFDTVGVGVAKGNGTANGSLTINNGSILIPPELNDRVIDVGSVLEPALAAVPTAVGDFTLNGDGSNVIQGQLRIAEVVLQAGDVGPASATGSVAISDATIVGRGRGENAISVCNTRCRTADCSLTADAMLALERVRVIGSVVLGDNADPSSDANGASLTTTLNASITDSTIEGNFEVGNDIDVESTDSAGSLDATLAVTGTTMRGSVLEIGDVETDRGGMATMTIDASFADSDLTYSGYEFGDCEADDEGDIASLTVTANFSGTSIASIAGGALEILGECDADGGQAIADLTYSFVNSPVAVGALQLIEDLEADAEPTTGTIDATVAASFADAPISARTVQIVSEDVDTDDTGRAIIDATMAVNNTTVTIAEDLTMAIVTSDDDGVAEVDALLQLTDVTTTVGGDVVAGSFLGDSSQADNRIDAVIELTGSLLTANSVTLGLGPATPGTPNVELLLNPSLVQTDDLTQSVGGSIHFDLEGLTRVTDTTAGATGTYAAIDAATATLDGEVSVRILFLPPDGIHHFDLIAGGATSTITDNLTAKDVDLIFAPGFSVQSFEVVEDDIGGGTVDILRLTIGGAFDPTLDSDGDGSPDAEENDGPNMGDGNGDGIPDAAQSNVTTRSFGGSSQTIMTDESCPITMAEVTDLESNSYEFPFGALSMVLLDCPTTNVTVYYHEVDDLADAATAYVNQGPNPPGSSNDELYRLTSGAPNNLVLGSGELPFDSAVGRAMFTLTDGERGDDTEDDGNIVTRGGPATLSLTAAPAVSPPGLLLTFVILLALGGRWLRTRGEAHHPYTREN